MAVTSSFFGSINGDRRYKPADFAAFFADFIGNGVYAKPSSGMQVMEKSNMTITVKPGTGFINGYRVNNDSDYDITLATADGVLKRIDRIVLQWDNANRAINIVVKKGAFASNPIVPSIQRDADYYELVLADVLVGAGVTRITQASIIDQRLNNALCGIVTGLISQVDTTTLFNQYQSWINQQKANYETNVATWTTNKQTEFIDWSSLQETDFESWSDQQRTEFDNWFASIKDILDSNVASNLQTQIEQISNEFTKYQAEYLEFQESKGQPNGFSGLDAEGKVPWMQLPEMNYIPLNEKGKADGTATLGSDGLIPTNQLPGMALTDIEANKYTFQTRGNWEIASKSLINNEYFSFAVDESFIYAGYNTSATNPKKGAIRKIDKNTFSVVAVSESPYDYGILSKILVDGEFIYCYFDGTSVPGHIRKYDKSNLQLVAKVDLAKGINGLFTADENFIYFGTYSDSYVSKHSKKDLSFVSRSAVQLPTFSTSKGNPYFEESYLYIPTNYGICKLNKNTMELISSSPQSMLNIRGMHVNKDYIYILLYPSSNTNVIKKLDKETYAVVQESKIFSGTAFIGLYCYKDSIFVHGDSLSKFTLDLRSVYKQSTALESTAAKIANDSNYIYLSADNGNILKIDDFYEIDKLRRITK